MGCNPRKMVLSLFFPYDVGIWIKERRRQFQRKGLECPEIFHSPVESHLSSSCPPCSWFWAGWTRPGLQCGRWWAAGGRGRCLTRGWRCCSPCPGGRSGARWWWTSGGTPSPATECRQRHANTSWSHCCAPNVAWMEGSSLLQKHKLIIHIGRVNLY